MADVDTTRSSTAARSSTPAGPRNNDDWAVQTADTIERMIETVRSNTSDRLVSIARLIVFGLLAAILGMVALVFLVNLVVRFMDSYLGSVWGTYLILGGLFTLIGLLLWQRAWKRPARDS